MNPLNPIQDLRQALKALLSHPAYFVTALLTLAMGIGFSTATFSVVNAVLLRPLPYDDPHELLRLRERFLPRFPQFSVSPGHYLAWRDHVTVFDGVAAWGANEVNLDDGSGRSRTALTTLKMAVLKPMPAPSVTRAVMKYPGWFSSVRRA